MGPRLRNRNTDFFLRSVALEQQRRCPIDATYNSPSSPAFFLPLLNQRRQMKSSQSVGISLVKDLQKIYIGIQN